MSLRERSSKGDFQEASNWALERTEDEMPEKRTQCRPNIQTITRLLRYPVFIEPYEFFYELEDGVAGYGLGAREVEDEGGGVEDVGGLGGVWVEECPDGCVPGIWWWFGWAQGVVDL